ncbi:MAG: hypothetical protein ABSB35_20040 [Bryobacteraceae bacterium]
MRKLGLSIVAIALLNAQPAQDPADVLAQVRDKLMPRLPSAPRYTCIATINRSYYSRKNPPLTRRSCEQILEDKKRGRTKLQLDKTDRWRLDLTLTQGHEIYSWAGPGAFSRSVEEFEQSGPAGTGVLGPHLHEIFSEPAVQFRVLGQNDKNIEYGFRVPIEASSYLIWAGSRWRETGYDGSFVIDPGSLELRRLTLGTGELPPETSACEESKILDYPSGGTGVFLPNRAESHFVMRDTTETESLTTLSDCRESTEKVAERPPELIPPLPADVPFKLELTTSIDTSTAAAGDVVTARLPEAMNRPPKFQEELMPKGAILTGRIMRMEHHLDRQGLIAPDGKHVRLQGRRYFLIWVDFDRVEVKGVVSSFSPRFDCDPAANFCLWALVDGQKSKGAFLFPTEADNFVVPAGYVSTWFTNGPLSK